MKILVTGSSGYLGEALCRTLTKKGIEYDGIDIKAGPYTTLVGSITNKEVVKDVMQNIDYVIHTATLHKPHVITHSKQGFIDTNITGTLCLLEEAIKHDIEGFIYTSTTSTFGDAMTPAQHEPAVWVTETTNSIPKNIYGVTKTAAENICQLFYRNYNLPCLILKTSRFFPEEDDKSQIREGYDDLNAKANEFLYRRVDIEDVVYSHLLAIEKVKRIGFRKFIISATTPFDKHDLHDLHRDAPKVVQQKYPAFKELYAQKQWQMFPKIGRVYVNERARNELAWKPSYDFQHILDCLKAGKDYRSHLAIELGIKGYHDEQFEDGPYPV